MFHLMPVGVDDMYTYSYLCDAVKCCRVCVCVCVCVRIQEAVNMVIPAMQLAGKIPDVHVQLWASALLKGSLFLLTVLCTN